MKPFIFPAMGSHGAATAEGQADVLAHYGITEATHGHAGRQLARGRGARHDGRRHRRCSWIGAALASDGVMLVGRVKWHTALTEGSRAACSR